MIGERDEKGAWQENEPETPEGQLAWSIGQLPALWQSQSAITAMGSFSVPSGFDHVGALTLAEAERPALDRGLFLACTRGLEQGRAEAARAQSQKEQP